MNVKTPKETLQFFLNWTLAGTGIIPVSYMVSLIAVLLVHGAFGFSQTDPGTHLSQTLMQVAGGSVIGLGTGMYQKDFLRKRFKVRTSWIYFPVIGFAVTELVACLILWALDMDRYKLRFIEGNPLPEALIFACAGMVTGILQVSILKKHFAKSGYWIIASTLGWGICILTNLLWFVPVVRSSIFFVILVFAMGAMFYGIITGFTLTRVLKPLNESLVEKADTAPHL